MSIANNSNRLVNDLAAEWTDSALAILKNADVRPISVDMEVQTWHTLADVLQAELRWQRALRVSTRISLSMLREQVFRKTTLLVAQRFAPQPVAGDFESRIYRLVRDLGTTAAELALYTEIVRQPAMRAAFNPPSRTDYVPRLRVRALAR